MSINKLWAIYYIAIVLTILSIMLNILIVGVLSLWITSILLLMIDAIILDVIHNKIKNDD